MTVLRRPRENFSHTSQCHNRRNTQNRERTSCFLTFLSQRRNQGISVTLLSSFIPSLYFPSPLLLLLLFQNENIF